MSGRLQPFWSHSQTVVPLPSQQRPFLVEVAVDGETPVVFPFNWSGMAIRSIAAMCDEDSTETQLALLIQSERFLFDRRYLARIWPGLFHLPNKIFLAAPGDRLSIRFPGKAIVVVAGSYTE